MHVKQEIQAVPADLINYHESAIFFNCLHVFFP